MRNPGRVIRRDAVRWRNNLSSRVTRVRESGVPRLGDEREPDK